MLVLALLASAPSTPVAAQQPPPSPTFDLNQVTPPGEPPAGRFGQSIYLENCAPCHGEQGLGDGPTAANLPSPPTAFADLNAVWERSPAELFHTTKFGRIERLMPPWQNELNDRQIWQVVAYAWSLHTDPDTVAMGEDLYALSCAGCHGESGAGDGPDAEGDLPNFGDLTYAMARSQADWLAGWQEAHAGIGGDWSQDDQRRVLEYIRTFSYVPAWESGYRPGPGVVRGQVVQGTPGAAALEPRAVTLEAFADFQPVATFTTTTDATGAFTFSDLAVDPSVVYLASVGYDGIRYSSPIIELSEEAPAAETTLTVYETTGDPSGIRIDRAHWIIDFQPGALLVGQIVSFGSSGDRTYVGQHVEGVGAPVTVAVETPPGATQVTLDNGALGQRFHQVGNLIYDTAPLIPGEATKQLILRYTLPYDGDSLQLSQPFRYPVRSINLLVAELPGLQATVAGLEEGPAQEFEGRRYLLWQGAGLPAESTVQLSLSGLMPAGATDPRTGTGASAIGATAASITFAPWMAWLTGGLAAVALAGVLLWSWRAGRVQTSSRAQDLARQRDELIRHIARLDDLHALGELDQESWQSQRAQLKARLLEVSLRLSDSTA
ncbi:MAG TPA: c-type cytochrome [Caldilineaceae bacterium]|nr:c-type cytochrome [Caldilineaceae bacterium]